MFQAAGVLTGPLFVFFFHFVRIFGCWVGGFFWTRNVDIWLGESREGRDGFAFVLVSRLVPMGGRMVFLMFGGGLGDVGVCSNFDRDVFGGLVLVL